MEAQHLYLCDIQNISKIFIYQRFHFLFINMVAIHITLSQLTYILNLICGAKIDGKIEGKQMINRVYRYNASTSHMLY